MIHIMLCDDEYESLERTERYINSIRSELKFEIEIKGYSNAEIVLEELCKEEKADILIMDIDMPKINGLEMARMIREKGYHVILIFLTAHEEYVFDSFEYAPFRYIRKEFMKQELLLALRTACEKVDASREVFLNIKSKQGIDAIKTKDILYFEMENRKCVIYTIQNQKYEVRKKISELQEEVRKIDTSFLQIYKGCIVNKRYVKSIQNNILCMENEIKLPISRRKKQEITNEIMEYWGRIL